MPLTRGPDRRVVERELLHQARVPHRELLHLELVVGQVPVRLLPLGSPLFGFDAAYFESATRSALACASRSATRTSKVKPASRSLFSSPAPCSDDLDGVLVAVLGQVEAEGLQPPLVLARRRVRRRRPGSCPWLRSAIFTKPIERSALERGSRGSGRPARPASGRLDEAFSELVGGESRRPATKRPALASNTPRSQSPRPDSRAWTRPDSVAVVRTDWVPAAPLTFLAWQTRATATSALTRCPSAAPAGAVDGNASVNRTATTARPTVFAPPGTA